MPNCRKCKENIKPALIAVKVKGKEYHPACVSCSRCDRGLWGKSYVRSGDGSLQCERACTPSNRPPSSRPPSSTQPKQEEKKYDYVYDDDEIKINKNGINKKGATGASRYAAAPQNSSPRAQQPNPLRPDASLLPPRQLTATISKNCNKCKQSVINKKHITHEDGEINCQSCSESVPLTPRPKSSHIILCSVCNKTVTGTRYFTEPDNTIVCTLCDQKGPRCFKCKGLFKFRDSPCIVQNPSNPGTGIQLHKECFDCANCGNSLEINNYFQTSDTNNLPICPRCYDLTQQNMSIPHDSPYQSQLNKNTSNQLNNQPQTAQANCVKCTNPIIGPCFIVENQPIHHDCFRCSECQDFLNTKTGFYKNSQGLPICLKCDTMKNLAKCAKCFGPISEMSGVSFMNKSYHAQCYTCFECNVNLTTMKKTMTDKDDQNIYCEGCFIKCLAPRCSKCSEPIYAPHKPGTRYEDKNYHLSCFTCARCRKTLAEKKFFRVGNLFKCEACF